jgi:hypothetical protein
MLPLAHFLLLTALTIQTNTLVLRSGARIPVDGVVRAEAARVIFRSAGALYTVATEEVDLEATREAGTPTVVQTERPGRLKVSPEEKQRLLKDLEENHSGSPGLPAEISVYPEPTPEERAQTTQDEWSWKRQARAYEEGIRRAEENFYLLRDKAAALRAHIGGLLGLGYKPAQFSYDTTLLAYTEEQIPNAELEVQRAQRAYEQFRDEARRLGVPPGWLR